MKTKTVLCLTFLILLIFHFSPLVCFALTDEEIQKFQSLLKAQPVGERKFDLIICDVMMPNKTGWEVVKEIKSSPKLNHIPIIVLTAKNEP